MNMINKKMIYEWLKTKTWVLEEKNNGFEYCYDKQDYDDYINEEDVLSIIKEDTKEKRYDKFYEILDNCNFHDYENETIYQISKEFCNENDLDYEYDSDEFIEIEDIISTLISFNYDTYLNVVYNVNIIIDFNGQDSNTEFSNSSNLENCKNNNLYTLLRKQGYFKKDYINNLDKLVMKNKYDYDYNKIVENGGSKFLTSVYEEINNNYYDYLTSLVVLKKLTLKELIEDTKINVNVYNTIGLFNWYYGSGSLLEVQLEKDFVLDRKNDVFTIQVEHTNKNVGYSVDEVYGLIDSCWEE